MPLLSTFRELANGHQELLQLLKNLSSAVDATERAICLAVISLSCDDPQHPPTGEQLYKRLLELFGTGSNPPDLTSLAQATEERIDQLRGCENARLGNPAILTFFRELGKTHNAHDNLQPIGVN